MRRKSYAAIAAILLSANSVYGQGIWVEGDANCGDWTVARRAQSAAYYEHYLLGFLNGLSLASQVEFWSAGGGRISREQAYFWMDSYCTKNPLRNLISGAVELIKERTEGGYDRFLSRPRGS